MQRRVTSQDISWFIDLESLNRLDLNPAYQRRSVWTRRDRQYFLDTIFNNFPSPAVFLHKELDENGSATYHVIDGKQRLETIFLFLNGGIAISNDFGDVRISGKKWIDIKKENEFKKIFLDYQITVEQIDSVETTVVNDVFGRLNQNSRKLYPQELRHARYSGWFINRAEQESEAPFWKRVKISTAGRFNRMQDTQFVSELMMATIQNEISGFDQEALNEFYALYEFPEDLETPFDKEFFEDRFGKVKSYLENLEDEYHLVSKWSTNLAHFYSLWNWLLLREEFPDSRSFSESYANFMNLVSKSKDEALEAGDIQVPAALREAVMIYAENARGATTDIGPRLARHAALTAGLGIEE
ncbi:DUF262 domain-containing protein [Rhodococcus qingshengii]|uniref:DUF262 domain-containing protein n=1 Tax=Rhodococcus qingshengii TaxID=334542 RepID=UPI0021BB76B6|nr:DUF262 domain-containing protein [Rhodococcus qingshengii]UXF70031.1 DUF262 domain-containing protein [Rhodococcus qingshengii]